MVVIYFGRLVIWSVVVNGRPLPQVYGLLNSLVSQFLDRSYCLCAAGGRIHQIQSGYGGLRQKQGNSNSVVRNTECLLYCTCRRAWSWRPLLKGRVSFTSVVRITERAVSTFEQRSPANVRTSLWQNSCGEIFLCKTLVLAINMCTRNHTITWLIPIPSDLTMPGSDGWYQSVSSNTRKYREY